MTNFSDRYGPWAVVAGGSEGLGLAFATGLAARGINLVLVAHEPSSLDEAAEALSSTVEVAPVLADLGEDGVERTLAACEGRDVGLLVANAAVSPRGFFLDTDPDELVRSVRVNVEAPVRLARALGPAMRDRGRGGILLVSSMSSLQGTAVFSTYAGTKSFLRVQAEGLWDELRDEGVDVLAVVPGTIDTPGLRSTQPRGGPRPVAPRVVAEAALDHLGDGPVLFPTMKDRVASIFLERLVGRRTAIRTVSRTTRRMFQ